MREVLYGSAFLEQTGFSSYSLLLKLLLKLFVIIQDGFAMPNCLILMKWFHQSHFTEVIWDDSFHFSEIHCRSNGQKNQLSHFDGLPQFSRSNFELHYKLCKILVFESKISIKTFGLWEIPVELCGVHKIDKQNS